MSDGAQDGVMPMRALGTILGGEAPPTDDEKVEWYQLREKVLAATPDIQTYDDACLYTAKLIIDYWEADNDREAIPSETVYERDENGEVVWGVPGQKLKVLEVGLYQRMKADDVDLSALGLSGFQWGWAVNAARWVKGLPPEPNPAIITIDVGGSA